jgi:hypothetical protein
VEQSLKHLVKPLGIVSIQGTHNVSCAHSPLMFQKSLSRSGLMVSLPILPVL